MKTVQQKLRWPGVITIVTLLALMFSSCVKHTDGAASASTSNLAVLDASPTAPPLDFYIDGERVNSTSISYGGGLSYFVCYAGSRHAAFYQSGTTTVIASDTVTVAPNGIYTLLLSNLPGKPDVTLLRDSIFTPASSSAELRFVNASPDAGNVDFGIKGKSLLATNIAYRKYTPFMSVSLAASFTDTLQVYQKGTTTVLQSVPITFQQGSVYTVYLYGFAGQTSDSEKLNTGVMVNTSF